MRHRSADFLDQIVSEWEKSQDAPSALAVCNSHPDIRETPALVVKLAYEEFRMRRSRGENLVPQTFCQQFEGCEHALSRMLSVHAAMEQHPSWLAELSSDLEGDAEELWPIAGHEFLRFKIVREIGRGGLARVYLAQEQVVGNRLVVLKVSTRDSGEARIMGRLQHSGIMPIHQVDFEPLSGLHVVVMPFLGTTTLYDVLGQAFPNRQGTVPTDATFIRRLAESGCDGLQTPVLAGRSFLDVASGLYVDAVVELGIQLAEALAYTHERGVLHRDLKPSNILVTPQGIALLMDFNLSARTDGPGLLVGGTIPYMPPELLQALSGSEHVRLTSTLPPFASTWNTISTEECATNDLRGDSTNGEFGGWIACADPRSDVFSWAVIIYEMLTGQLPFGEPDVRQPVNWQAEWVRKRQVDRTIERHSANQHIPDDLFDIVRACLAVEPDARPASAMQLVEALVRLRQPTGLAADRRRSAVPSADSPVGASLSPVVADAVVVNPLEVASRPASSQRNTAWFCLLAAAVVVALGLAVSRPQSPSPDDASGLASMDDASFLLDSANELMAEAKWSEAHLRLQRAAELGEQTGKNFALQAYCLLQENHIHGGSNLGRSAIEANYANPAVLNNYGYALLKTRRYSMARRYLNDAARQAPNESAIHHNLAMLEFAEQNHDEAIRQIRRALELHPVDSIELHWDAARIFADEAPQGSPLEQEAVRQLEAAIGAGLDRATLATSTGTLQKIAKLVDDKNVRFVGGRRSETPRARLLFPTSASTPHTMALHQPRQ